MPFVSSYFRRAPGAAANEPGAARRRLDVAIYDDDGTTLLRDATGGRWGVKSLSYGSSLPGGFATASFRLERPTARTWAGRAGLKCVIRRGAQVVWWGWVEDLQRAIRGGIEYIDVTCLGPYQHLKQRLCSVAYTGTVYGDYLLANILTTYCPEISQNFYLLASPSVNVAPLTLTNEPVTNLVRLVCEAGNSSGQQMLFTLVEPPENGSYRVTTSYPSPINLDPEFSQAQTYWQLLQTSGSIGWNFYTTYYHSPAAAPLLASGGAATGSVSTTDAARFAVTAGTSYIVDYWVYFDANLGSSVQATITWFIAGWFVAGTSTLTSHSSTGTAGWSRYVETATAPAGALFGRLNLGYTFTAANRNIAFDDAYVYVAGSEIVADTKPRARLWARDLSAADYYLYTAELDAALQVNETTSDLTNYVLAKYGSSYTAAAQDATSQGLYRRRDAVVDAGSSASSTLAAAYRDTYLARYKDPGQEPGGFRLARPGALRNQRGAMVWPEDVRAGERVQIADGPLAGTVVLLTAVEYSGGVVTCTPERVADVPLLLSKVE